MCQFYGMTLDSVKKLPFSECLDMWNCITMIEAQDTLLKMKIAVYPNMDAHNKNKLHREMYKKAFIEKDVKVLTTEELARKLGIV